MTTICRMLPADPVLMTDTYLVLVTICNIWFGQLVLL